MRGGRRVARRRTRVRILYAAAAVTASNARRCQTRACQRTRAGQPGLWTGAQKTGFVALQTWARQVTSNERDSARTQWLPGVPLHSMRFNSIECMCDDHADGAKKKKHCEEGRSHTHAHAASGRGRLAEGGERDARAQVRTNDTTIHTVFARHVGRGPSDAGATRLRALRAAGRRPSRIRGRPRTRRWGRLARPRAAPAAR